MAVSRVIPRTAGDRGDRDAGAVTTSRLTGLFATLLRAERQRRDVTQAKLAALAGVSQATVTRVERGDRGVSLPLYERLLAALGIQLTLRVEPLDAHIDAAIDEQAARPLADRIAATDIDEVLDKLTVPFVFDGATAALLQGAPVPAEDVDIAVRWSDADIFTDWLTANYGQRWHEQWQVFGYLRLDPREPGEHRWRTIPGVIRARMCDELPVPVTVTHAGRAYAVVPLADVEIDDERAARLLRHYRRRGAGASYGGSA
jgi:transcriptional regulator with XRE-family HTH domain